MPADVLAAHHWPTNAHLIEDVARLGYLDGHVIDLTFGRGGFWKRWVPTMLTACDLSPDKIPDGGLVRDFRDTGFDDNLFDSSVLDPPYKLSGTPALDDFDDRYGIEVPTRWQDRMQLIHDGTVEALRLAKRFALIKCQDQVCSGQVRWQTDMVTEVAVLYGCRKVDRFDLLTPHRPQPGGRTQRHAAHDVTSQLLVFDASQFSPPGGPTLVAKGDG